jgi:hypothetical protein
VQVTLPGAGLQGTRPPPAAELQLRQQQQRQKRHQQFSNTVGWTATAAQQWDANSCFKQPCTGLQGSLPPLASQLQSLAQRQQ